MQFPNNFEHYLEHKLKYGGGVLPNTPTEEFENVLFWTFNKSAAIQYAIDLVKVAILSSEGSYLSVIG